MGNTAIKNIHDTYHLQKVKLGEGSFGIVWRGVHRRSGEVVAVKQLNKAGMPARGVSRADVEMEIRMVASLLHGNVIRLHQVFEDERSIYMALEYCEGGDFGDKVLERGCNIDQPEMARWMQQLLSAVAFLHGRGVCHRDIKPDNFLVAHQPDGHTLKLADLGLAAPCPAGRVLTEKCGTPAYMAPEQHLLPVRSRGYGLPVDVWAAGLCMYQLMFGGRHPFLLNGSRGLNERGLLEGTLDFSTNSLLGSLGVGGLRMTDEARLLCQSMVNPRASPRLSAAQALDRLRPLLQGGGGPGQPAGAAAGSPKPGPRPGARERSLSRTPKEGRGSTQALKDAVARVARLPAALAGGRKLSAGGA